METKIEIGVASTGMAGRETTGWLPGAENPAHGVLWAETCGGRILCQRGYWEGQTGPWTSSKFGWESGDFVDISPFQPSGPICFFAPGGSTQFAEECGARPLGDAGERVVVRTTLLAVVQALTQMSVKAAMDRLVEKCGLGDDFEQLQYAAKTVSQEAEKGADLMKRIGTWAPGGWLMNMGSLSDGTIEVEETPAPTEPIDEVVVQ